MISAIILTAGEANLADLDTLTTIIQAVHNRM